MLRVFTASHVPAREAYPQRRPWRSEREATLAAVGARRDLPDLAEMLAVLFAHKHPPNTCAFALPAAATVARLLHGRTLDRSIRAEHAAVAGSGPKKRTAMRALVEVHAGIDRHRQDGGEPALRAGQDGLEDRRRRSRFATHRSTPWHGTCPERAGVVTKTSTRCNRPPMMIMKDRIVRFPLLPAGATSRADRAKLDGSLALFVQRAPALCMAP